MAIEAQTEQGLSPPPTKEEIKAANKGAYAGSTRIAERIGKNKTLRTLVTLGEVLGITGASAGVGYGVYRVGSHFYREAPSDFTEHLNKDKPLSVPVVPKEAKGIKSEGNTIQMTREEYEKIAPPAIDRTNLKVVPVTLNITPRLDGRTTRSLTLEQGTTVNAMIYIKTPEGNIREVSKTKIANPGGGVYGTFVFPNCRTLVGLEGEIQAGDKFPAPISGRVYYQGEKVESYEGQKLENAIGGNYVIEGEYYDEKTGKTFKTMAYINMLYTITKPLIPNLPNSMDPAFNIVDADGSVGYDHYGALKKMPIVTVQQGQDLFSFRTKPTVQNFSKDFKIKSQLVVSTSYQGDLHENGIGDTFGGENCNHPTVDNKEIVLK